MREIKCVFACVFVLVVSSLAFGYSGSLSSSNGGLQGTGGWVEDDGQSGWFPADFSWTVTRNTDGTWHYEYLLSVYRSDPSHLTIQVSNTFRMENLFNATGRFLAIELDTFGPSPGNHGIHGSVYGVKFDSTSGTPLKGSFDSDRCPVWGDFYAKGGKTGGSQNAVWNVGFLAEDPDTQPHDGSEAGHLLVPDTLSVPEPVTGLLLMGAGLSCVRRRMRGAC